MYFDGIHTVSFLEVVEPETPVLTPLWAKLLGYSFLPRTLKLGLVKLVCRDCFEVTYGGASSSSWVQQWQSCPLRHSKQTITAVGLWPGSCSVIPLGSFKISSLGMQPRCPICEPSYTFPTNSFLLKLTKVNFCCCNQEQAYSLWPIN